MVLSTSILGYVCVRACKCVYMYARVYVLCFFLLEVSSTILLHWSFVISKYYTSSKIEHYKLQKFVQT